MHRSSSSTQRGVADRSRVISAQAFGSRLLADAYQDLNIGVRSLRSTPLFTAVTVVTLTIAIGANSAIFSLVNAVLFRPISVPEPDRVVRIVGRSPQGVFPLAPLALASYWLELEGAFEDVAAHRLDVVNLTRTAAPEQVMAARVTARFFRLYGARLALGRTFSADEPRSGGLPVTVLSHGLWTRQFGGNQNVLGQNVFLGDELHVIIGVLEPEFDTEQFAQPPDLWVPATAGPLCQWGRRLLLCHGLAEARRRHRDG
jgi:putative ABC transport system permease protein